MQSKRVHNCSSVCFLCRAGMYISAVTHAKHPESIVGPPETLSQATPDSAKKQQSGSAHARVLSPSRCQQRADRQVALPLQRPALIVLV